jgi:hypothetical protein
VKCADAGAAAAIEVPGRGARYGDFPAARTLTERYAGKKCADVLYGSDPNVVLN